MVRYFKEKLTQDNLDDKIDEALEDSWGFHKLTPKVEKDLKKVEFDEENMDAVDYHTLDNGLTYLEVCSGGDWENLVSFIIYWDGSELRGYIPKEGNIWNTDTKQAYGNDEEKDVANGIKRGFIKPDPTKSLYELLEGLDNASHDLGKMQEEIQKRIQYKE